MGRTSNAKEHLLESVMELIWIGNYGAASVDQICERAGVKKGSFYHFFPSKTELALAAIDASWAGHREQLDKVFSPVEPPLDRIWNGCALLREIQHQMATVHGKVLGCPIHSFGAEISTVDEPLRLKLQEILDHYIRFFESAIRDAHDRGEVSAPDAEGTAKMVFAYVEGLLLHGRMRNELQGLDDMEAGTKRLLGISTK